MTTNVAIIAAKSTSARTSNRGSRSKSWMGVTLAKVDRAHLAAHAAEIAPAMALLTLPSANRYATEEGSRSILTRNPVLALVELVASYEIATAHDLVKCGDCGGERSARCLVCPYCGR